MNIKQICTTQGGMEAPSARERCSIKGWVKAVALHQGSWVRNCNHQSTTTKQGFGKSNRLNPIKDLLIWFGWDLSSYKVNGTPVVTLMSRNDVEVNACCKGKGWKSRSPSGRRLWWLAEGGGQYSFLQFLRHQGIQECVKPISFKRGWFELWRTSFWWSHRDQAKVCSEWSSLVAHANQYSI